MQYPFGDTDLAAYRLQILASIFRASSLDFIQSAAPTNPKLISDLGCGPGFTTRMLAELFPSARVVGLDFSERFIALASASTREHASFLVHDVTSTPFPHSQNDLIHCRLLLAHLPDPINILAPWAEQLRPGGRLLIDEVEWIKTRSPVFSRYLEIVSAMMAAQGSDLYVGEKLAVVESLPSAARVFNRVHEYPVADNDAARMFSVNLRQWSDRPYVRENISASEIESLRRELDALVLRPPGESSITWGWRQLAFESR